jgi:hypothetical protein
MRLTWTDPCDVRCAQADDEYMISDYDLLVSRYISVPRTYGSFTPAALVAGIVRGMLDAAGFAARYGERAVVDQALHAVAALDEDNAKAIRYEEAAASTSSQSACMRMNKWFLGTKR